MPCFCYNMDWRYTIGNIRDWQMFHYKIQHYKIERIDNMDWSQIIANVGFPIVSFLLCGKALKYVYDKERKSLDDTIAKLGDLTAAVNHNSEVIAQMSQNIGKTSFLNTEEKDDV